VLAYVLAYYVDGKLLAMVIYINSSFGDPDLYLREINPSVTRWYCVKMIELILW